MTGIGSTGHSVNDSLISGRIDFVNCVHSYIEEWITNPLERRAIRLLLGECRPWPSKARKNCSLEEIPSRSRESSPCGGKTRALSMQMVGHLYGVGQEPAPLVNDITHPGRNHLLRSLEDMVYRLS